MKKIISTAIPLPQENIDTDQIMPARFLKATTREDFGQNLFIDWRKDSDFVLNNTKYSGKILVAGRNFGCGSSREHAAWGLVDYGFKVVVSSFFADIFKNNALNNLLLPIVVSDKTLQQLFELIESDPNREFTIDIEKQLFSCSSTSFNVEFDLNPYKKLCFMEGIDDVGYLLSKQKNIETFETTRVSDYSFTKRNL